jgi:lambda family phage tail tape measure protein
MNDEKQALSQHLKDIKNLYDIGEIDGQQFLANTISAKEQSLSKQYEIAQKEYQIASDKKNPSAMQDRANQMKKIQAEMYNDAVQYSNDATALAKNQQAVVDSYADKIVKAAEIQQEALQNTIAKSTLGDKQAAQYDQLLKLKKEYISAIAALDDKHNNKNGPNALTDKQYSDMKASAKQGYEDSIDAQKKTNDTLDAIQDDWYAGALKAYANYRDNAASVASQTQTAFTSAFQSMENALVTFVTTGKLDFKSLATSILADLDRIIIKQQLAAAYKSATSAGGLGDILGNAFGISSLTNSGILNNSGILGMGGDGTAGAGFGLASGWSGAASIIPSFADGGSFTNGVVTRPTNFSTSQMGEAGPEAIMPLAKMSDGSLGIKQSGTSDASKTTPDTQSTNGYTTIHVHVTGTTAPDVRRSAGQGAREALSIMSGAQRYV